MICIADVANRAALAIALNAVEQFICRFVVLTIHQSKLIALWVAQTHALDSFDFTAYLNIHSPLPECGKTRLLEVLEPLVAKPWMTGRVTAAVLMRKVDAERPVLLLDESDAAFNGDEVYTEALRGMLNSGFQRSGKASVCVGQGAGIQYRDFSTFCPKAISGIGKLPATVASRSIPIALKRRAKAELIAKFRKRAAWEDATPIREAMKTALAPFIDALRNARPVMPEGLSDRAEDVIEPLLVIAEAAGDTWATDASAAAVVLMGVEARAAQEADQNLGLELLADVRDLFESKSNPTAMPTKDIIAFLVTIEDRPWATFSKGDKPITGHRLARLLKGFGVVPAGDIRIGDWHGRGYSAAAFDDAFARYLPSKVRQRDNVNNDGPGLAKPEARHERDVTDSKLVVSPDKHCESHTVTVSTAITGRNRFNGRVPTPDDPPFGISPEAWKRHPRRL